MPVTAIVMNVFYTGLGIARSLAAHGVPVIGLSAQRMAYGNFTRCAKIVRSPDSRSEPEALIEFFVAMSAAYPGAVIFPTRDDDVYFLDRYRSRLEPHFRLVVPPTAALHACVNKWATFSHAQEAGVPSPRCWVVEDEHQLRRIAAELPYPCVLKPVSAHHWRRGGNWRRVGARKAIGISSAEELFAEYSQVSLADKRALVQEMVPGGDESLVIAACYMDRNSNFAAGFNTQKVVQVPPTFGTGCIVQTVDRPELFEPTVRLLRQMGFTGIAEVEYKWNAAQGEYQLIEVNPRPWDQHRLGAACGVDLIHFAYCDHAGLPAPTVRKRTSTYKWIAEDTFASTVLRLAWTRDPSLGALFRSARGKRIFGIWSAADPAPSVAHIVLHFLPGLLRAAWHVVSDRPGRSRSAGKNTGKEGLVYDGRLEKGNRVS